MAEQQLRGRGPGGMLLQNTDDLLGRESVVFIEGRWPNQMQPLEPDCQPLPGGKDEDRHSLSSEAIRDRRLIQPHIGGDPLHGTDRAPSSPASLTCSSTISPVPDDGPSEGAATSPPRHAAARVFVGSWLRAFAATPTPFFTSPTLRGTGLGSTCGGLHGQIGQIAYGRDAGNVLYSSTASRVAPSSH